MRGATKTWVLGAALLVTVGLAGCATALRDAVPLALANSANVSGFNGIRWWGDAPFDDAKDISKVRWDQIKKSRPQLFKKKNHTVYLLALSGGGSDGAYGAGFLNGWTASGNRPEFEVVTGVSAGALMAPFAFLGPEYDDHIREIYTKYSTKDILLPQVLAGLTGGVSVSNSQPLADLIARYVDKPFVAAVAREHKKGRRLLIGTTNLDQERPVVWDMGRIASRGGKKAVTLFRKILLASASIPGLFPPVFIDVEAGGKHYHEMHVDGGTTENAFLLPAHLDLQKIDKRHGVRWKRRLYVIANLKTEPSPEIVKPTAFGIAGRSISTLIKQQTEGDILKLYLRAKQNRIAFSLASIPTDFSGKSKEPFDRAYMGELYAVGFNLAKHGYRWEKKPPGL